MVDQDNRHRALIVIDVQNEYDDGNLPIEFPPFKETVPNVAKAIDAAQAAGVKVITVQHVADEKSPAFARGSHGVALYDLVRNRPHDHHIEKKMASAFAGTDLENWLIKNGVTTLTVIGYMTHNCDLSTVIYASHMGFTVEFLSDATGALPYSNSAGVASAEEIHRVVTVVMHTGFAAVATTDAWIDAINTGKSLPVDNVLNSNRNARQMSAAAA
jgi:nicotinamidase-related amidase